MKLKNSFTQAELNKMKSLDQGILGPAVDRIAALAGLVILEGAIERVDWGSAIAAAVAVSENKIPNLTEEGLVMSQNDASESGRPFHHQRPDLGFNGEWRNECYFAEVIPGEWSASVYGTAEVINIQFFARRPNYAPWEDYVWSVLQSAKGEAKRDEYHSGLTDWLSVVCIINDFKERHS